MPLRILPLQFSLSKVLASVDNLLSISGSSAAALTQWLVLGDHIYLQLQDSRGWEIVKYTHSSPVTVIGGMAVLSVDRAQFDTVRRSWPTGQCLVNSVTEGPLREFDLQNVG